jgi:hypothetical protein
LAHVAPAARFATQVVPLHQLAASQSALEAHEALHAPATHATYGEQEPWCGAPLATFVHVPSAPPTSHAWQLPAQPELQHRPSTHQSDWHSP